MERGSISKAPDRGVDTKLAMGDQSGSGEASRLNEYRVGVMMVESKIPRFENSARRLLRQKNQTSCHLITKTDDTSNYPNRFTV